METKLTALKSLMESEKLADMIEFNKRGGYPHDKEHVLNLHGPSAIFVSIKPGRKYTKVDVGTSGAYMVVNETGEIFGIKAYGVIHRGHQYGTLDTINNFYWGGYTATRKN